MCFIVAENIPALKKTNGQSIKRLLNNEPGYPLLVFCKDVLAFWKKRIKRAGEAQLDIKMIIQ